MVTYDDLLAEEPAVAVADERSIRRMFEAIVLAYVSGHPLNLIRSSEWYVGGRKALHEARFTRGDPLGHNQVRLACVYELIDRGLVVYTRYSGLRTTVRSLVPLKGKQ